MTDRQRSTPQVVLAASCCLMILALSNGCQSNEVMSGPVRSIWVTRFDYQTADDVVRIIDDCADAGFNTVLFQVRGNGTAFYDSAFEPWDDELGGEHPGFDPLGLACRQADERDVELHAWVNVMPAWRGKTPPVNPDQLYNRHPEWFWYDQYGDRQALSSFYVSLNPCLPEVREYLVDVFRDLMQKYPVDGLHMDYIRFPSEPPATPRGTDIDYPYDDRTLALYREETGLAPSDDVEAWDQWRTDQVTQLVADISAMMKEVKPGTALTAAVGANKKRSLKHHRDAERWVADGTVDAVFPMNYKDDLPAFEEGMVRWLPYVEQLPVVPGLWFSPRVKPEEGPAIVRQQIEAARKATGHFCLFAYSSLFDSDDEELTNQGEKARKRRSDRREELMPFLQELAGGDED